MKAVTNFKSNYHFNPSSYYTVHIHSPSWFAQQLQLVRVKQPNGSRAWFDGSLCVLVENSYTIKPFMRMYFDKFFTVNPMDCLRVIFDTPCYSRIKWQDFNK